MPELRGDPAVEALLLRCSEILAARLGLHFPPERFGELARKLGGLAAEVGCGTLRGCLEWLAATPLDALRQEMLASHLTVGETYFFREPAAFAALERRILPLLLRRREQSGERRLRLWSAGCSSGEEAYSLALLVDRLLPGRDTWKVSILGTDINPRALATAVHGVYGDWSFRGAGGDVERFAASFAPLGDGRRRLVERIRAMVSFAPLNLAGDGFPAPETNTDAVDVIFCRNVLMYFRPDRAKAVVERLAHCLADGGWLVVGAVEASLVSLPGLLPERGAEVILFRRASADAAAPAVTSLPSVSSVPSRPNRQCLPSVPAAASPRPAAPPAADSETLVARARDLANRGRLDEALACCEAAVAGDKLNPAHTYLLASILLEQGRLEAAAAAFRRTLYLDPERALAHFSLAGLLLRLGRAQAGLRHYRQARALLAQLPAETALAEAGGVAAGRLLEVVDSLLAEEAA